MFTICMDYNNKPIEFSFGRKLSGDDLMHLCHSQCQELSDISLFLNAHDEIMIKTMGQTRLVIERYGRKRICKENHPLMLFTNDILWIGDNLGHRFEITEIRQVKSSVSRFSAITKKTMLASAAALAMATVPACHSSQTPESNHATASELNEAVNENPEQSETDVIAEPPLVPDVVPEPEEPHPHPVVIGKPALPKDESSTQSPTIIQTNRNDYPRVQGIPKVIDDRMDKENDYKIDKLSD